MKELAKILSKIQSELNCPKNQKNTFGNYNYRSCEDIVEAVKPLLHKHNLYLMMYDNVVNVGNHNYIEAIAMISNGDEELSCKGVAREAESQKGMADSQLTGSTSSYARKYALNGLFAIDDTKDADTMKPPEKKPAKKKEEPLTIETLITFVLACKTVESLNDYYRKNEDFIKGLMEPEEDEVKEAFRNHKKELEGK